MRPLAAAVLAALLAASGPARANGPRIVLDQLVAEPSWVEGHARLRLFVTPVTIYGKLIEVSGDRAFELRLSGSRQRAPYLTGRFGDADAELALVLVVQRGFEVAGDFDHIQDAARQLVDRLPRRSQTALVDYGADVHGGHRMEPTTSSARRLGGLQPDPAPAEPHLIDAVERALKTLRRAGPTVTGAPLRKLVVVFSDGKDIDPEPERYRKAGQRAERDGIRIHSIAYSPVDNRRPLLGLGELSKRSGGTFRWVRTQQGFGEQVRNLVEEIEDQVVLTFLLPEGELAGKRVEVSALDATSNALRIAGVGCGGGECAAREHCVGQRCVPRLRGVRTSVLGWAAYIAGGVVLLFALLSLAGYAITRSRSARQARAQAALAAAGAQAQAQAQAGGHRIAGVDPNAPQAPHRIAGVDPNAPRPAAGAAPAGPVVPAGAAPAPTAAAPSRAQPALFVVSGPGQGQRIAVTHGLVIGSAPNCQVSLAGDPFASAHHAQILVDTAGGCTIVDRGSTNGTFVNGVRMPQGGATPLRHGMSIKIGGAELRFLEQ